jgi:hypothetical protein
VKNFQSFLVEALTPITYVGKPDIKTTTFVVYPSKMATFPNWLFYSYDENADPSNSDKFTIVTFPKIKIPYPTRDEYSSLKATNELDKHPYFLYPKLFRAMTDAPIHLKNEIVDIFVRAFNVKVQRVSRAKLGAFLVNKNVGIGGAITRVFGEIIRGDVSGADVHSMAGTKRIKGSAPERIGPFVILYPPMHKDKESLAKMVKVAIVCLKRAGVYHLFTPPAILNWQPLTSKKTVGVSIGGGIFKVDPAGGYHYRTVRTTLHEMYHWLEDKYPQLEQFMKQKISDIRHQRMENPVGSSGHNYKLSFRPENVIDPKTLVGRTAKFTNRGKIYTAKITDYSSYNGKFTLIVDDNQSLETKVGNKIYELNRIQHMSFDAFVNSPGFDIVGVDVMRMRHDQWQATTYAGTNHREFGAEMFADWTIGKLHGEPAAFMRDVFNNLNAKSISDFIKGAPEPVKIFEPEVKPAENLDKYIRDSVEKIIDSFPSDNPVHKYRWLLDKIIKDFLARGLVGKAAHDEANLIVKDAEKSLGDIGKKFEADRMSPHVYEFIKTRPPLDANFLEENLRKTITVAGKTQKRYEWVDDNYTNFQVDSGYIVGKNGTRISIKDVTRAVSEYLTWLRYKTGQRPFTVAQPPAPVHTPQPAPVAPVAAPKRGRPAGSKNRPKPVVRTPTPPTPPINPVAATPGSVHVDAAFIRRVNDLLSMESASEGFKALHDAEYAKFNMLLDMTGQDEYHRTAPSNMDIWKAFKALHKSGYRFSERLIRLVHML